MSATPPPGYTPPPDNLPQRGVRATFSQYMDAWITWFTTVILTQLAAMIANAYANAVDAFNSATNAAASALSALNSANAASAAANVTKWVAGTFADGAVVWDPLNGLPYRNLGAGVRNVNPSLDAVHWVIQLYVMGLGGQALSGNITLTSTSPGAIVFTPTAPGQYVTLPDATTCTKAALLFTTANAGDYDYGVKNNTGTVLGWIRASDTARIGLADNSTAAGSWTASGLQKTAVTAIFASTGTNNNATATQALKRVPVDANRTLFVFGAFYAVVYDASTQTWGSPVLIRTSTAPQLAAAILAVTDKVLVVTGDGSNGLQAVILSLSGTAITVNTAASASTASNITSLSDLVNVSGYFATGYYSSGANTFCRAIFISGTTCTWGAESSISSSAGPGAPLLFVSGSILRAVCNNGGLQCTPFSLSGAAVLTPGTSASVASGSNTFRAMQNGNGNLVALHNDSAGTSIKVAVFKLTGTTEAISVSTAFSTGTGPDVCDWIVISGTKTAIMQADYGTPILRWNIHTDTAGASSCGTADSLNGVNPARRLSAVGMSGNNAKFAVYSTASPESYPVVQHQFDCSGASPARAVTQAKWGVSVPQNVQAGSALRHPTLLIAGSSQYALGQGKIADTCFTAANILAMPALGESYQASTIGAAANESWFLSGISGSGTIGSTIKRIEACA